MAQANPRWGAPRIHGELLKLGIDVCQATVAKYMGRRRQSPLADVALGRSLVLSHFARFTSRGWACDGAGNGASSSRARPASTARLWRARRLPSS